MSLNALKTRVVHIFRHQETHDFTIVIANNSQSKEGTCSIT
jgi:hypothetical protein